MKFECYKDKRVLVTGHTGFKGSWLCAWLSDLGAKVTGVALDPVGERGVFNDTGIRSDLADLRCDIRSRDDFSRIVKKADPEIVFHLAAQPLVLKSYQEPLDTFDSNIVGTYNLLDSLRESSSVKGVVCITTDKVYENKETPVGYKESDQLGGYDPYSASKAACELVIASYGRSFFNTKKVPLVSVRAGNVIGGGDWAENRLVPDFFNALENASVLEMRSPSSVRPWQHVMEPLSGYLSVGASILNGKITQHDVFNFGPRKDAQLPVSQIVDGLNQAVRVKNAKSAPVTVKYVDPKFHETSLLWLNCEKAFSQIGWQPRLDIATALSWTTDYYMQNLNGASQATLRGLISSQIRAYTERMLHFDNTK